MKKTVLVTALLAGTIILGGCGAKQESTQVNHVVPVKQPAVDSKNDSKNNELQKSIINPYHPIVFIDRSNDGKLSNPTVLGGYKNNKWYTVEDFDYSVNGKKMALQSILDNQTAGGSTVETNLLKGDETFKFYSNKQLISTVNTKGSKPTLFVSPASGQAALSFSLGNMTTSENFIIGVNGDWNALPRIPKILSDNSLSVDLDNDGRAEKVTTTFSEISKDYYKAVVEVEKDNRKIKVSESDMAKESLKNYKLMALDLNGDGKMELITYTTGTAGGISVEEFDGNEVKTVLGFDSGE